MLHDSLYDLLFNGCTANQSSGAGLRQKYGTNRLLCQQRVRIYTVVNRTLQVSVLLVVALIRLVVVRSADAVFLLCSGAAAAGAAPT